MIGHLSGIIRASTDTSMILDVGGVGYLVFCTPETIKTSSVDSPCSLWTFLSVRENSLDLFGFKEQSEHEFFQMLLNVPGIGPRSALSVCAIAPVEMMARAIQSGDSTYLTKVSGIGKKSAEKIVLELRDKVIHLLAAFPQQDSPTSSSHKDDIDVVEALTMMGYSQHQAREALSSLPEEMTGLQARLTASLKHLGKK